VIAAVVAGALAWAVAAVLGAPVWLVLVWFVLLWPAAAFVAGFANAAVRDWQQTRRTR
jgi:hypothetical protein